MKTITLCSPVPSSWQVNPHLAERDESSWARGLVVGIIDNGKFQGFADALREQLLNSGARAVEYFHRRYQDGRPDDEFVTTITSHVEAVVVGLGN